MVFSKLNFVAATVVLGMGGVGTRVWLPSARAVTEPAPFLQESREAAPPHPAFIDELTPQSFSKLRELVRPSDEPSMSWRKVNWYTDLWMARQKSVAENKPILLFDFPGAGYRDPLGFC